jgi:hypothetical protein
MKDTHKARAYSRAKAMLALGLTTKERHMKSPDEQAASMVETDSAVQGQK